MDDFVERQMHLEREEPLQLCEAHQREWTHNLQLFRTPSRQHIITNKMQVNYTTANSAYRRTSKYTMYIQRTIRERIVNDPSLDQDAVFVRDTAQSTDPMVAFIFFQAVNWL